MNQQKKPSSRRGFFKKGLTGAAGITFMGNAVYSGTTTEAYTNQVGQKLPREIVVASLSQHSMQAASSTVMVDRIIDQMNRIVNYSPDIICLPETFPFANIREETPPPAQVAESTETGGPVLDRMALFARNNSCYVICPLYTKGNDGRVYNAAVLIDRSGNFVGEYRKIHPAPGEIESGISPGLPDPPVFQTNFGTIGMQICFDIKWQDAWKRLGDKGAEMVFWPSAFSGGQMIQTNAWMYQYFTVSSSWKDTTRICDLSGEPIAWTGRWDPTWAIATVNLEKIFIHAYPLYRTFDEIREKYGNRVSIKTFHEEEWAIIESRSPEVRIADLKTEFALVSQRDFLKQAEENEIKAR